MDKNGKIKGKVSIIDVLVVLLVILVAVGIGARYGSKVTDAVQSDKQFECVLRIENVRQYTVTALEKMGCVTDKKSEKILGKIVDVKVENATEQTVSAAGEVVKSDLPKRYTCFVTIQATGQESDDNYVLADSTELSVGRNIELYSKYVKTSGDIMSVKVTE